MCFSLDVSAVFIYQITIYVGLISSISFSLFTGFSTLISFFVDRLICIFEFEIMIVRSRLRELLHILFPFTVDFFWRLGVGGTCLLTEIREKRESMYFNRSIFHFSFSSVPSFLLSLYISSL